MGQAVGIFVMMGRHLHLFSSLKLGESVRTRRGNVVDLSCDMGSKIVGESATYNTWHWVKGPSFQAQKGTVKVELNAREDGVFIDQVMLTSDLERVPVGIELPPARATGDLHDANK